MAIDFSGLTGALFDFSCFERLKGKTTASDGINLCILEWVTVFGLIVIISVPMLQIAEYFAPTLVWPMIKMLIMAGFLGLAVNLVVFLVMAALASAITAAIGNGKGDFGRTAGLLGYVSAGFTILAVVPACLLLLGLSMMGPIAAILGALLIVLVMLGLGIWCWISAGKAVSVAVGTSWGAGIAGVFLASLVGGVVAAVLSKGLEAALLLYARSVI